MPAERIGMRDAREIIRLKFSGVSTHEIARRLGMARSTVREALKRADVAGLAWPLPEDMNHGALEAALYASRRSKRGHRRIEEPDWAGVHRELKRKHVTLLILWDEYIAANPGGYSYSRFCELYRSFEKTLSVTMRQTHAAGERLFVDYAGDGVPVVVDRLTGEIRMAQIFVAVLGASSFTFAKATWTQALPDWIDAHVRAFEAIGGVPELVVPDNAKTAIVKASFYDPEVNRSYAEMAAHYRTAILPARPRSHHCNEDIGLLRGIAGLTLMAPCDANAIRAALPATLNHGGPIYFRVGRGREAEVYDQPPDWKIGGSHTLREGRDTTVFAIGNLVKASLEAHDILAREGIGLGVVDMYSIRPIDEDAILAAAKSQSVVLSAEEHNVTSGFGSAVAEVLASHGMATRLIRIGMPDQFSILGPPTHLYRHYGLDGAGVAHTVREALRGRRNTKAEPAP